MDETKKHSHRMVVEEVGSDAPISDTPETTSEPDLSPKPEVEQTEPKAEITTPETKPEIKKEAEIILEKPKSNKFNLFWILIPGLLILGLLMGGVFAYYNGINKIANQPESSPTPETIATPSPIPTPSSKLDLSKYPISVLNGSGIAGEAGKVKTILETAGFTVSSTGNAKTYDFTKTEISVKTGVEADFVQAIVTALGKTYQLEDPKTASTQSASIIITVGNLKVK